VPPDDRRRVTPIFGPRSARLLIAALAWYGAIVAVVLHTPATEWLAQPLYVPAQPASADAIVVLDAWASGDGEVNDSGVRRSMRAAELFRSGAAKTVVLSGSRARGPDGGSGLPGMFDLITRLGVPPSEIVMETESRNTHESAAHVAALARTGDWRRVVLVTDGLHMRRASLSFSRYGLSVQPAPVLLSDMGGAQPSLRLRRLRSLVHEYGGVLYYWWKGWI
jgi:uncharacterized SAM-binding protein YcdF (DUF218 family)